MKFFRTYLLVLFLCGCCNYTKAQLKSTTFQQLDSIVSVQPKPTIIFIHTDWCKYCAAMKQSTFKNKSVIESMNKNYYFIDFNAESRDEIFFNNRAFSYLPTGLNTGIHELAKYLGAPNGEVSYPMIIILDVSKKIIYNNSGYISSKQMNFILQQFLQK